MFAALPPSVRAIFRDKRLTLFDRTVFVLVFERLDYVEYRELTLGSVASDVADALGRRPGRSAILRSMRRITDAGYLHRLESADPRQPGRYRLRFSALGPADSGKKPVPLGATASASVA